MNPWIDIGMLSVVIVSLIFLRYEIPRALNEIDEIFDEARRAERARIWYNDDGRNQ